MVSQFKAECAQALLVVASFVASGEVAGQNAAESTGAGRQTMDLSQDERSLINELEKRPVTVELTSDKRWVRSVRMRLGVDSLIPGRPPILPVNLEDYKILAKLSKLEELSIFHINVTSRELESLRRIPNLKHLILAPYTQGAPSEICNGDGNLTDEAIRIVASLTSLESLDLSGANIKDDQLVLLAPLTRLGRISLGNSVKADGLSRLLPLAPCLREIDLRGTRISDAGLQDLASFSQLEYFAVSPYVEGPGLAGIGALKNLKRLDLSSLSVNLRDSSPSDGSLAYVGNLDSLEELTLSPLLTPKCLHHLAKLKTLRSINLPTGTTNDDIATIKQLSNLEKLSAYSSVLTDDGLKSLQTMSSLREATLPATIASASLSNLAVLDKLESLDLRSIRMSPERLAPIEGIAKLHKLRVPLATNDSDMKSIGKLTELVELDLSGSLVTGDGLAQVSDLLNLRRLNVQGTRVKDEHLKYLTTLANLDEFDAFGTRVTVNGIEGLARQLPKLASEDASFKVLGCGVVRNARGDVKALTLRTWANQNSLRFRAEMIRYASRFPSLEYIGLQNEAGSGMNEKGSGTDSGPSVSDQLPEASVPQALFAKYDEAKCAGDVRRMLQCLTPDARDEQVGSTVLFATGMRDFTNVALDNSMGSHTNVGAEVNRLLKDHGFDESRLKNSTKPKNSATRATLDARYAATIDDGIGFAAAMQSVFDAVNRAKFFGPPPVREPAQPSELVDIHTSGDHSTAIMVTTSTAGLEEKAIAFERIDGQWYINPKPAKENE
jgi:internalin A